MGRLGSIHGLGRVVWVTLDDTEC